MKPTDIEIQHIQMVIALAKPGLDIIQQLDPRKAHLWHMSSAIQGEAGELFDAVKKNVIYDKPLDLKNIIEELGDLEFYLQGLRYYLGISRRETLQANIDKLAIRYSAGKYSDKAAQDRVDKEAVNKQEPTK